MKKVGKIFLLFMCFCVIAIVSAAVWRFFPIRIKVDKIVRGMGNGVETLSPNEAQKYCESFEMTSADFERFFREAKPIFDVERDEYDWSLCYYKAVVDGKEYRVRESGIGEIWKNNDIQFYIGQGVTHSNSGSSFSPEHRQGPPFKE